MTRRSRWLAISSAIGVGAVGAYVAFVLAGGRWAAAGAVLGAVTGSFAPSVYDALIGRGDRREALRATAERAVPQSPARLLDPRRELVEFVGREGELKELQAWCTDKEAGRLRLVTGPGGVGKTRLSVELADRMRKAGWKTERVADGQEARVIPALDDGRRHRFLLIVDYAETRAGLNQMLSDLAGEHRASVRVLLLARSVGDWWDRLGVASPAVWDQAQAARQTMIELAPAVSADLSDAEIVALAVRAFAAELKLPVKTVELGGQAHGRRVLDLHAAALVAVLDQASRAMVRVNASDVLNELLRHEQHFWYDSAAAAGLTGGQVGLTQRQIRQMIAAACLLGAATQDEARALPARVPGLAPSATIADWLRALYPPGPGEAGWIGSLQPDRLAELHAISQTTTSPELAQACLTSLDARQALHAVTVLARASADYPNAEDMLRQTLPDVADIVATIPTSVEELSVIYNAIPHPTVVLAPAAVSLCRRILGLLPADADPEVRALWLRNLGTRLSALGGSTDALDANQEAVTIYRELAAAIPDRYRPDLAGSLSELGVTLSELGRPADALPPTEEAIAIRRELAAAIPDRYRLDLAASVVNLGVRYFELGRPADALSATQEAVAIYRELDAMPHQHRSGLASSLEDLNIDYLELGRAADALQPIEDAVSIRRELAVAMPDRYRPDLARALNQLGATLLALDRPADALRITQDAVGTFRELVDASPDQFLWGLAESLLNLGTQYSNFGRPVDALTAEQEAIVIFRKLAAASPDRYRPVVAVALNNLGFTFSYLSRPADALRSAQDAVDIFRELASTSPERYSSRLAESLGNLARWHSELGRPADALLPAEEAAAFYRELASTRPDQYRPYLAPSLGNLAEVFLELGRSPDALPPARDAVGIYRALDAATPDRYRPDLVQSLNLLAAVHEELGHAADAATAREEAARIADARS